MNGSTVVFWALAPLTVIAAVGMLVVKKAVHSAILLAFVIDRKSTRLNSSH